MTKKLQWFTATAAVGWLGYWVAIHVFSLSEFHRNLFTDSYSIVPFVAAGYVFTMAKQWGGKKSVLGKSLEMFAAGLFLQFCDQFIYTIYYLVTKNDLTFPNVGDVPYILSGVAYSLAVYYLLKVIKPYGSRFSPAWVSIVSAIAGVATLAVMYTAFIQYGIQDERGVVYSVLNTLYPMLQAVYFVLGIVALLQSRLVAKGLMFLPILLLLIALAIQFGADFVFLYQSYQDTWEAAGMSDLLYALAYTLMAVAMYAVGRTRNQLVKLGAK